MAVLNRRDWRALAALSLALPIVAGPAHAALLEVGAGKPYATIQAATDAAQPGDTVLVHPGVYTDAQTYEFAGTRSTLVHIKKSGTEAAALTLKAAGPGVVLDGGGATTNCVWGRDLAYVVVDGFECRNVNVESGASGTGAMHFYMSRFITIQNNYIHAVIQSNYETKPLIYIQATTDSRVRGNRLSARSIGITVSQGSARTTIEANEIHGNDTGIADCNNPDAPDFGNGIYLSSNSPDSVITRNYIHDYGHSAVQIRDSVGVTFSYNVVYNAHGTKPSWCMNWGVQLRDWDTTGPGPNEHDQHRVFNNVIDTAMYGLTFTAQNDSVVTNNIIMNVKAVFMDSHWSETAGTKPPSTGLLFDYNLYFNYEKLYEDFTNADCYGGCPDTGYTDGGHNLVGVNPGLVASGARPLPYYRLVAGSPAIDAGDPATPPGNDFAGTVVPLGPRADIGAFEYAAGADTLAPAAPTNLTVQ
ncbi:MAG TPA: right-handed parallel beta-helix repeat-containing protein [Acidiferrobacterales bacterium]|nr:right-handed parallel beta-helix repeat-containing protein [Acidiferrobacterales bacterium]